MRSWMAMRSATDSSAGLGMSVFLTNSKTGDSAIHQEVDAGHEAGGIAGEEQDGRSYFLRCPHTLHRCVGDHLLAHRRNGLRWQASRAMNNGSVDGTRTNHVDSNAAPHELGSERTSERAEAGFARRVYRAGRQTLQCPDGPRQHDGGALRHQGQCLLHGEKNTFEVDVLNAVPIRLGNGLDG